MTSSVIRSCICEVEGGKGWTNQIDHPGLRSKKLAYDDPRQLRCFKVPLTLRHRLTGRPPRSSRGLSPPLIGLPLPLRATSLLSQDGFCLSSRRSPQSRLHSDLASRSAVSQGSFHHRSGRGGGGRSRHHPAGEAVSGEERVPTCQLESVGSRCCPPAD